jgi:hypothetical protein
MQPRNFSKDMNEVGVVWFVIPMLWVVAAIAGLVIVSYWPTLLADPLPAESSTASNVSSVAPYASSDPSLPAAISVFKDRSYEVSEHVDTF